MDLNRSLERAEFLPIHDVSGTGSPDWQSQTGRVWVRIGPGKIKTEEALASPLKVRSRALGARRWVLGLAKSDPFGPLKSPKKNSKV